MDLWPRVASGWVWLVDPFGAGSGLWYPISNHPWVAQAMTGVMPSSKTIAQPLGGEKGRAKLLHDIPVCILQVSLVGETVSKLIGSAAVPVTRPALHLALPAGNVNALIPGAGAWIVCAGASARTAEDSCHICQGGPIGALRAGCPQPDRASLSQPGVVSDKRSRWRVVVGLEGGSSVGLRG